MWCDAMCALLWFGRKRRIFMTREGYGEHCLWYGALEGWVGVALEVCPTLGKPTGSRGRRDMSAGTGENRSRSPIVFFCSQKERAGVISADPSP